jgi:hypothetical protein
VKPYFKINQCKKRCQRGSNGRMPAQQAQGPEFNPSSAKKKKKTQKRWVNKYSRDNLIAYF